ncbi:MAG: hypothetical protein K1W16_16780 [Lachnospiraceae bacterium]
MTNKERYKQAFSALPSSQQFYLEEAEMMQIHKKHKKNIAVAAAIACAVIIGGSGTVYAADIGGIQEKLSIWLYGKQTEVEVNENENGGYTFTYDRGNGSEGMSVFGGVSFDADGSETWLTADELAEQINNSATVEKDADGKVWVYYYDQKQDITDLFTKNGVCQITMTHEGKTVHLTITENGNGGYSLTQTDDNTEPETSTFTTTTTTNIITTDD